MAAVCVRSVSVGVRCLVKRGASGRLDSSVPLVFEPICSLLFNACLSIEIF